MDTRKCTICKSAVQNEILLGEFKQKDDINVHYFCLLLSAGLGQNGEDDEGILGFLPADIKREAKRVIPLKCSYCRKPSANLGCCVPKCRKVYHLNCGVQNNCLYEFYDEHKSFCDLHYKQRFKETNVSIGAGIKKHKSTECCTICGQKMQEYNELTSILAPCCKGGWFHHLCLMKFSKISGYFFKCPLCNNADQFRETIVKLGIFIPDEDAAWEREPDAFSELLERPTSCEADKCNCRKGRTFVSESNELLYCKFCGSHSIHENCWKLNYDYICTECQSYSSCSNIVTSAKTSSEKKPSLKRTHSTMENNSNETLQTIKYQLKECSVRLTQLNIKRIDQMPLENKKSIKYNFLRNISLNATFSDRMRLNQILYAFINENKRRKMKTKNSNATKIISSSKIRSSTSSSILNYIPAGGDKLKQAKILNYFTASPPK